MKKNKISIIIAILSVIVFSTIIFLFVKNSRIFSTSIIEEGNFFYLNNILNVDIYNNKKEVEGIDNISADMNNLELSEDKEIKMLIFGDIMLDRNVLNVVNKNGFDYIFENLKKNNFLEGYDFVMANLEGATTNSGEHYNPINLYDFAFNPELVSKLKEYNFNIFTLANNHLSDQGEKGISETYNNLSDLGFNYFGCKDAYLSPSNDFFVSDLGNQEVLNSDNCSNIVLEKNGKKIAFLSFSIVYSRIDEDRIVKRIEELKEFSDYVVVVPHWGLEYKNLANKEQETLAHKMIDAGADIIIAHHPHVIQNLEEYNGKEIYYSLGNFVFDQYFSQETQEGLAVKLVINEEGLSTEVYKLKSKGSRIEEIKSIDKNSLTNY
ncbi:CapA family protein [bacterium]|nr:CapA family protein [bacterium]